MNEIIIPLCRTNGKRSEKKQNSVMLLIKNAAGAGCTNRRIIVPYCGALKSDFGLPGAAAPASASAAGKSPASAEAPAAEAAAS